MEYQNRLNKNEWVVRSVSLMTARHLIEAYHYARSGSNTATYTFGLFRRGDELMDAKCLGITWWLPPTRVAAEATYPEGDWKKVLSLSRMVITPEVPKNACSFLLARSIRLIDRHQWKCLVTYADTWQGHTGGIYRASNWEYLGTTAPSSVFVKDGKMMGRKRGAYTLKKSEIEGQGFEHKGNFEKHKFRLLI